VMGFRVLAFRFVFFFFFEIPFIATLRVNPYVGTTVLI